MNKNLNNMTLRERYTRIISLKTLQVNIFQILDWQRFFSKETFIVPGVSHFITNFTQFCEIFKNTFFYKTPLVAASLLFYSPYCCHSTILILHTYLL